MLEQRGQPSAAKYGPGGRKRATRDGCRRRGRPAALSKCSTGATWLRLICRFGFVVVVVETKPARKRCASSSLRRGGVAVVRRRSTCEMPLYSRWRDMKRTHRWRAPGDDVVAPSAAPPRRFFRAPACRATRTPRTRSRTSRVALAAALRLRRVGGHRADADLDRRQRTHERRGFRRLWFVSVASTRASRVRGLKCASQTVVRMHAPRSRRSSPPHRRGSRSRSTAVGAVAPEGPLGAPRVVTPAVGLVRGRPCGRRTRRPSAADAQSGDARRAPARSPGWARGDEADVAARAWTAFGAAAPVTPLVDGVPYRRRVGTRHQDLKSLPAR